MANRIWLKRVEAWRKSGLSSIAFAEGKPFTGGGLRHMAFRLRASAAKPPQIRLARIVRAPTPEVASSGAVVLVVGTARIEVGSGATREVLTTVLAALAAQSRE